MGRALAGAREDLSPFTPSAGVRPAFQKVIALRKRVADSIRSVENRSFIKQIWSDILCVRERELTAQWGNTVEFKLANVANRAFGSAIRNFWVFAALTALLVALPQVLIALLIGDVQDIANSGLTPSLIAVGILIPVIGTFVLQGAIVRGAIVDFNSGRANLGDCFATGLRHFFPIIVISILVSLGVALGTLLLVIPGIMIAVAWIVAVPSRVVENAGIFDSIRRSADLTRGNRWSIFWLFVIYIIIVTLITGVTAFLGTLGAAAGGANIMAIAITAITTILTSILGSTGVAALYFELRQSKEGIGAEELVSVFD